MKDNNSGCNTCPVEWCYATYRGSECAANRSQYGVVNDPKTKGDCIRDMNDDELKKFFASICEALGCPPNNPETCIDDCEECWGAYISQPAEGADNETDRC